MAAMLAMETEKRESVLSCKVSHVAFEASKMSKKVVHCYRKDLTCCLCGICRDYSVCFQCYADGQACEERRRVQHGQWLWSVEK
jgi:hypothetical protein